jgi:uncharacterized protein
MGGAIHDGFLPGRHLIDAYGNGGFRFGEMSHRGSILALPSGVSAWPVETVADLTADALERVLGEPNAVELLLLGTGETIAPIPNELRRLFRDARVALDVMQTSAAARTYNVLAAENRMVGAALIAVR